jgi:hypothetical protein
MNKLLMLICVSLLSMASYAQSVPELINYQGRLTDENGNSNIDDSHKLEFNIYDAASAGPPHPCFFGVKVGSGVVNHIGSKF